MNNLGRLFDGYARTARLYPALLTFAPLVWTLGFLHPQLITGSNSKMVAGLIGAFGGLFLLSSIARHCGKRAELRLFRQWEGARTTTLLRHRDDSIDPFTKARYHSALQKLCGKLLTLPTEQQEFASPAEADLKYESATKCLIENRRTKEYWLVHHELASYGFRRNLLGLKPIGLIILTIAIAVNLISWYHALHPIDEGLNQILEDVMIRWQLYALFLANLGYFAVWLFIINDRFVLHSADEYAVALFRSLESSNHKKVS
ncbi:hypothetical protein [Cellvibrio sp. KY-YJ-3]|uniref:hypothetical protein n=1 Tax=Cellvibrio sp. KY-YJ-3 TaxID=454662 RepID=UPI001245CE94|nr:hypothetical protein [Cellvibrio sp. KY-YJ-3]QEY13279.1 hypothetical protein D0B88_14110 [Cellvibrio sp. KY-YJ-3]